MSKDADFDIYFSLGLIVRGRTDSLKDLIEYIKENPELTLVFTKTSVGKLRIVETEDNKKFEKEI